MSRSGSSRISLLFLSVALVWGHSSLCAGDPKPQGLSDRPARLVLETAEGSIEVELFEAAAPAAIERLKSLVEGSARSPAEAAANQGAEANGYYDGLSFDFTRPHIEIVTEARERGTDAAVPNELNAESLGLDRQLIVDTAEAMLTLQRELLIAHREKKKSGTIPEKLRMLLEPWFASYSPDFLIGTSRKEINEALGYLYQDGLESRPAVRGAVLLKPESPTHSSTRLSLLLADTPERTGRWMVIGKVTRGLEVAEAISIRPRVPDRREQFRPLDPVIINRARWIRDPANEPAVGAEGK